MFSRRVILGLLAVLASGGAASPLAARTLRPPAAIGTQTMVAADHPLASAAGRELLRQGGNAVDAACAAAFAYSVVSPAKSGIGGGALIVIKPPGDAPAIAIDARERAPAAAHADMFLEPGVAEDASRRGGLAVAVPGEVLGCAEAIAQYGKLPFAAALAPAIRYASEGFAIYPDTAASIAGAKKDLLRHPLLAARLLPQGHPLQPGQRLTDAKMARTLRAIAAEGPDLFYRGWIADDIVAAVTAAGGILSQEDLYTYRVKRREPLTVAYRGYLVTTMPPPSSGGVAIVLALNILAQWDLRALGHNSPEYLHLLAETLKHVFSDRARYLGDPDFVAVPVDRLTSPAYAAELAGRIGDGVLPLATYGSQGALPAASAVGGGTSHISVVDADGGAVALTTTINTWFGSLVVGERSGIILNDEMDDFAARPNEPNVFRLLHSAQNAVAPRKRPLSSMSPTLISKDQRIVAVVGGSGGPGIITGTLQVILNLLDFALPPDVAVSYPRIHHQWYPNELLVEAPIARATQAALARRGHRVIAAPHRLSTGAVELVVVDNGIRYGASDPRKQSHAKGD